MRLRVEAARRRTDHRIWVVQRRARTRQLIELGGLVQKSGLVELTGDDRAMLYGALLLVAGTVKMSDQDPRPLWKRHGHRAFEADEQARSAQTSLSRPSETSGDDHGETS